MSIGLEILKGQETSLIGHSLSNGKLYFCTDTGNVFLDTNNENENDVSRLQINANRAYYIKSKNETLYIDENFISLGRKNENPGAYSIAVGLTTSARGESSAAFGQETLALGKGSLASGYKSEALGQYSSAIGYMTAASMDYAQAEGYMAKALAICAHAEGSTTEASGSSAHAEGYKTIASAECSHAEGSTTQATGGSSHAQGYMSKATAACAHAEGSNTLASGASSHAQNLYTIAMGENQTAIGKFNIEDTTSAFIIGNGSSTKRSNAYQIDWNGNSSQKGSLQIGSYFILGDASHGYDLPETGVENQLFFQAVAGNELTTGNYEEYLPLDFIIHDTLIPSSTTSQIEVPSKLQIFNLEDFSLYADGLLLTQGLYYYFDTNYNTYFDFIVKPDVVLEYVINTSENKEEMDKILGRMGF